MAPGDNTVLVSAAEAGPLFAVQRLFEELSKVLTWQPTGGAQTPAYTRPRLLAFTYSSEVGWTQLQPLSKQCMKNSFLCGKSRDAGPPARPSHFFYVFVFIPKWPCGMGQSLPNELP